MTTATSDLQVSCFSSFESARRAWLDFEKEADFYAVQGFEWLSRWFNTVGHQGHFRPALVEVRDSSQRPLLFLPLAIQHVNAVDCLTWLGGELTDFHGPILTREAAQLEAGHFPTLWKQVRSVLPPHDVVDLQKQPEWIGGQRNPFTALPNQAVQDVNLHCSLEGDWPSYHRACITAPLRADSRRKEKRLSELGNLQFTVARTEAEIRAVTLALIEQKTLRYRSTDTFNVFRHPGYREFMLEAPREMLHVSALKLDDHILAAHWGLVFRKRFYYIMASFDQGAYAKYSPGRLMLERLFEWCFANGIETFDFTIGDEDFKKPWSNRSQSLYRCLESVTLRGAWYVTVEQAKNMVRRHPVLHRMSNRLVNRRYARRQAPLPVHRPATQP